MSKELEQRRMGSARLGQDPPLADWLTALSHDSPFAVPATCAAQPDRSPPLAAVSSLLSLLRDADSDVRLRAVAALGDLAAEVRRVLPALRAAVGEAALRDEDDDVRAAAVRALLQAGPQASEVGALIDALHSDVDVVRFHAAIALGEFGRDGEPAVPTLIHTSLWDEEPAVRVGAAVALWKIDGRGPLVVHVLTRALDDANELICWVAAECLGQMGPAAREAAPALRQALRRGFRLSLIKTGLRLALERIDPQPPPGAEN